jgi:hypothetical protein
MSTAPISTEQQANAQSGPLTTAEQNQIPQPADPWTNSRALKITNANFEQMSSYRQTSGHDIRLQVAEELYLGWQPKKKWEGTNIPRSSIGVPIAMDQIEALLPPIMGSIFPLRDNVEILPNPGTTKEEAQATFDLIMSQLDNAGAREVVRLSIKDALIYGNGILEPHWNYEKKVCRKLVVRWVPVTKTIFDPMSQQTVRTFTGENRRVVLPMTYTEEINEPRLRRIAPQDFFIDPNCEGPDVQKARFCAVRQLVSVGELKLLRGQEGFQIPADEILIKMAQHKATSYHDTLKGQGETYRFGSWQPQNDYSMDPDTWRLEVIRYYTKERVVWVFNRLWVGYNAPNTMGILPFLNAFYVDVPNRFYGYAVTDAVEGEQRLQQSVINARIDELNLLINSPFYKVRGTQMSQSSARMYPGKLIEVEKKDDVGRIEFGNVTSQAYMEVEASDRRAQKRTGVSDLSVLGTSSAGGNSANRTATGVGVQDKAASQRIKYQVENLEYNLIEPMLRIFAVMNQRYLNPQQALEVLGPDGAALKIDPVHVINANVKFNVRAADKMRSRMMVLQALPLINQTYFNPAMLQFMAQIGQTIDVKQFDRLLSDALQIAPMSLWRSMNPQEQQSMQQQQLAPKMMDQQIQQARLDAQDRQHQRADDTAVLGKVLDKVPDEAMHALIGTEPAAVTAAKNKPLPTKKK